MYVEVPRYHKAKRGASGSRQTNACCDFIIRIQTQHMRQGRQGAPNGSTEASVEVGGFCAAAVVVVKQL